MILILRPFRTDDFIGVGEYKGVVHSVGIFHTTLVTLDQRHVVIPNSVLTSEILTNYSTEPIRRIDVEFSASYNDDVDKVKAALLNAAEKMPEVLTDPAAEIILKEHGSSALIYRLRVWCRRDDYLKVRYALPEKVIKSFQKENISVPYTQVDVHFDKTVE